MPSIILSGFCRGMYFYKINEAKQEYKDIHQLCFRATALSMAFLFTIYTNKKTTRPAAGVGTDKTNPCNECNNVYHFRFRTHDHQLADRSSEMEAGIKKRSAA
jgi:hypothetical protein